MSHPVSETIEQATTDHGDGLSQVEPDDIGVGMLGIIGAFVAVALLLIAVLLQAWFYNWQSSLIARRTAATDDGHSAVLQLTAEQQAQLDSYHWVKREAGQRAIPIARAMELELKDLASPPGGKEKGK